MLYLYDVCLILIPTLDSYFWQWAHRLVLCRYLISGGYISMERALHAADIPRYFLYRIYRYINWQASGWFSIMSSAYEWLMCIKKKKIKSFWTVYRLLITRLLSRTQYKVDSYMYRVILQSWLPPTYFFNTLKFFNFQSRVSTYFQMLKIFVGNIF